MTRALLAGPVLALLGAAAVRSAPAGYEVELRMAGYTGLLTSAECDALTEVSDSVGYDVLTGVVRGDETGERGEDMTYTGRLKRRTRIDHCLTRPAPTEDQRGYCLAKFAGAATMQVEITVYGEAGRGAWVKAEPVGPADSAKMVGDCVPSEMEELRLDYPSGESAGSPSGQPIEESDNARARERWFFVNGVAGLRAGITFPTKPPETAWSLKVLRKVP